MVAINTLGHVPTPKLTYEACSNYILSRVPFEMITSFLHTLSTFSDAWPIEIVDNSLDILDVRADEVVVDPFVGSGTTALAARRRGHPTFSADCCAFSILYNWVRCSPFPALVADDITNLIVQFGCEPLLKSLFCGEAVVTQGFHHLLFVLVASWLNARRKQVDNPITGDLDWVSAAHSLLWKMRERTTDQSLGSRDQLFRAGVDDLIEHGVSPRTACVLITSPPFFGSKRSPDKVRADMAVSKIIQQYPIPGVVNICRKDPFHADWGDMLELRRYWAFQRRILFLSKRMRCRALAIETSTLKSTDGRTFHDQFRSILKEFDYRPWGSVDITSAPEPLAIIYAVNVLH